MNRRRPLLALALLAGLGLGAFALLSPESAAEPAERAAEASSSPARAATAPLPRGSVADAPSVSAPTSASLPSFEPAPGLTGEQLLADVAAFGEAGRMADHGAWLWEAVRRLRAEPALCAELAELALEEGATTQLLALDLLGNAASPEAQEAAVSLLERTTHRRDARVYGRMVQSLLLTPALEAETEAFLWREAEGGALAAVNVLGTEAGRARERGEDSSATVARLRRGLDASADAPARRAHLVALGNSGDPAATPGNAPNARNRQMIAPR